MPHFLELSEEQHLENITRIWEIQLLAQALSDRLKLVIKENYPLSTYTEHYGRLHFKGMVAIPASEPILRALMIKYGDLDAIDKIIKDTAIGIEGQSFIDNLQQHMQALEEGKHNKEDCTEFLEFDWWRLMILAIYEKMMAMPYKNGRELMGTIEIFPLRDQEQEFLSIPSLTIPANVYLTKKGLPQFYHYFLHKEFKRSALPLVHDAQQVLMVSKELAARLPSMVVNWYKNMDKAYVLATGKTISIKSITTIKADEKEEQEVEEAKSSEKLVDFEAFGSHKMTPPNPLEKMHKKFLQLRPYAKEIPDLLSVKCVALQEFHRAYELTHASKMLSGYGRQFECATSLYAMCVTIANFVNWMEDSITSPMADWLHHSLLLAPNKNNEQNQSELLKACKDFRHQIVHSLDNFGNFYSLLDKSKQEIEALSSDEQSSIKNLAEKMSQLCIFWAEQYSIYNPAFPHKICYPPEKIENLLRALQQFNTLLPLQDDKALHQKPFNKIETACVLSIALLKQALYLPASTEEWKVLKKELTEAFQTPERCAKDSLQNRFFYDAYLQALGETLGNLDGYHHHLKEGTHEKFTIGDFKQLQYAIKEIRSFRNMRTHHHSCNVRWMCEILQHLTHNQAELQTQLSKFLGMLYQNASKPPSQQPDEARITYVNQKLQPHCILS